MWLGRTSVVRLIVSRIATPVMGTSGVIASAKHFSIWIPRFLLRHDYSSEAFGHHLQNAIIHTYDIADGKKGDAIIGQVGLPAQTCQTGHRTCPDSKFTDRPARG